MCPVHNVCLLFLFLFFFKHALVSWVQSIPRYIARLHMAKHRRKKKLVKRIDFRNIYILNVMFLHWVEIYSHINIKTYNRCWVYFQARTFHLRCSKLWISNINYAFASNAIQCTAMLFFDMLNDMKTSRLLHSRVYCNIKLILARFAFEWIARRQQKFNVTKGQNQISEWPLTCFLLYSYEKNCHWRLSIKVCLHENWIFFSTQHWDPIRLKT